MKLLIMQTTPASLLLGPNILHSTPLSFSNTDNAISRKFWIVIRTARKSTQ